MLDDIEIRIISSKDFPLVERFMIENFYKDEPLGMMEGITGEDRAVEDREFILKLIRSGTSLIALQNGILVGALIAGTHDASDLPNMCEAAQAKGPDFWSRELSFLHKLEQGANIYERYNVTEALYMYMIATDKKLRRNGLAATLTARVIEIGREKGFPVTFGFATNFYTVSLMEAFGMEVIYSVNYADYKDENGMVVFNPPEPHRAANVMAMSL